jgi:hypothetical protein
MSKFISFHKIGQFGETVRSVIHKAQFQGLDENGEPIYDKYITKPVIPFTGTVKLHGTNASVCTDSADVWYQSRKRIISVGNDNYDFSQFCTVRKEAFDTLLQKAKGMTNNAHIAIFGEYCGNGVQSGVGISNLPKMFVIFAIKTVWGDEDTYWKPTGLSSPDNQIYNIYDFPTFEVVVDFNCPEIAQNKFVQLVDEVEKECPVAKSLGAEGLLTGEGIVWTGIDPKGFLHTFKTKGEKHSVSKVKKVASVDVEKVQSLREFVDYSVTENRLNQCVAELFVSERKEPTMKDTRDFIQWMVRDITEEEKEVISENGFQMKFVGKYIAEKAVPWFHIYLNRV